MRLCSAHLTSLDLSRHGDNDVLTVGALQSCCEAKGSYAQGGQHACRNNSFVVLMSPGPSLGASLGYVRAASALIPQLEGFLVLGKHMKHAL